MAQHTIAQFLEACGLRGPMQLNMSHRHGQCAGLRSIELPFVVIGRDPKADLVLSHRDISRRHAYLQVIDQRVFCVDLRSRTGVSWAQGSQQSGWVDDRSGIMIGPARLRSVVDTETSTLAHPLTSDASSCLPLPSMTLEFPQEPERRPWRLNRVLTLVGRAPDCRLRLNDPSVSKHHCSLIRTPMGVWVVDLLGRGGIDVDGHTVRWALLEHGQRLRVGPFLFRIRSETCTGKPLPVLSVSQALRRAVPDNSSPRTGSVVRERNPSLTPEATSHTFAWLPSPYPVGNPAAKVEFVDPSLTQVTNQIGLMHQHMCHQFQQVMMTVLQSFGSLCRDQMALAREECARLQQISADLQAVQAALANRDPAPSPTSRPLPSGPHPAGKPEARLSAEPTDCSSDKNIHILLHQRMESLQRERQSCLRTLLDMMRGRSGGDTDSSD